MRTSRSFHSRQLMWSVVAAVLLSAAAYSAENTAAQPDAATERSQREEAILILRRVSHRRTTAATIAVLQDKLPDLDQNLAFKLADELEATGAAVCFLDAEQITNPFVLAAEHFDMLILTNARVIPLEAAPTIARYLRGGGDVIALGMPAFERLVAKFDGRWIDREGALEIINATKPERILFDFETEPAGWRASSDAAKSKAVYSFTGPGAARTSQALHATVPNMTGWETISLPPVTKPFAQGRTMTCFWAKGDEHTRSLSIEWAEKDGSRWGATVNLTPRWQRYALDPRQFRPKGRGGAGDGLNPENAERLTISLAATHTGPQMWSIDQIGVAKPPPGSLPRIAAERPPELDTLSPGYRFYPMTDALRVAQSKRQSILSHRRLPKPARLISSHVRGQATGYRKNRNWRWVPLMEATDSRGRRCGFPATMLIHAAGPSKGAAWVALNYSQKELSRSRELRRLVIDLSRVLARGVYLLEGGSDWYTYFDAQKVTIGATVANFGRAPAQAEVLSRVKSLKTAGVVFEKSFPIALAPGKRTSVDCPFDAKRFQDAPYTVEATLRASGTLIDSLRHEINVWRPKQKRQYMTARDEDFYIGTKKWYPHGVNYIPSSGIAIDDGEYSESWLSSQSYNPDVIDVDLDRIAAMKLNMVSVFVYHRALERGNLLDLLRRCEERGLRVSLSLRPGTPLDFQWPKIKAIIENYRLKEHDNVFAYDIAWEPAWGKRDDRRRWDGKWRDWIVERYGSIADAERDWGVPCPKLGGRVTGPSDEQVSKDGPWGRMVAAYRMFLDCLLSRSHAEAARLVKSVDPNHLVSCRMTISGDPTADPAHSLAYDLQGLARSMEIICPGGHGRVGDWSRVRPGHFTAAYARMAAPGRPVMWADFGLSVWDRADMQVSTALLERQAEHYEMFYRMMLESGSTGGVCWWYPGGLCAGENGDFGIINPDGTARPVGDVISRYASKITRSRPRRKPNVWLTVDRDAHAGGIYGMYKAIEKKYWAAVEAGRYPGLRTEAAGKDSANVRIVSVGNGKYTGKNPPKYFNAEFSRIEIRDASGRWRAAESAGKITIDGGKPIMARAAIVNTGEVKWLGKKTAAGRQGLVALGCRARRSLRFVQPIPEDVPPLADARVTEFALAGSLAVSKKVVFEMTAVGRAWFGEKIEVTLVPK